jgi:heme-degrading monooxygenase HmoA
MFVVLFEAQPHGERWDEYVAVAAVLRPEVEGIDGFIDNTGFAGAGTPGRLLSLSTWRDEKSVVRWRSQATHRDQGQQRGCFEIFSDYLLRVAEVTDDTHPSDWGHIAADKIRRDRGRRRESRHRGRTPRQPRRRHPPLPSAAATNVRALEMA